jgi:hypothetical protein
MPFLTLWLPARVDGRDDLQKAARRLSPFAKMAVYKHFNSSE